MSQVSAQSERKPSGRGRAALALDWWPGELPQGTDIDLLTLIAHDGEVSRGWLYTLAETETVFCLMHPRQEMHRHPLIPQLLDAGAAVWAQSGRDVGNDLRLVHESALLDVAAGMEFLRARNFERIVLIGISGGAGLYSFYAEQSLKPPGDRFTRTPAGAPTPLAEAEMPPPDLLALVAPHPGQGRLLLNMIDPSVETEAKPLSVNPDLDPYNPDNGYGEPPEGSTFSEDFLAEYRAAQRARVERIDERARDLVQTRLAARKRFKAGGCDATDRRQSVVSPIITTYRTDADPRCTDLSLDPSDRPYGSVISPRPSVSNYGPTGFGRLTTPDAWLSTWSGLSSNASVERALAGITIPALVIEYTGDCSVFPGDVARAVDALDTDDVEHHRIRADHFGRPLTADEPSAIPETAQTLIRWKEER